MTHDTIRFTGILALVVLLARLYVLARTLYCGVCLRPFAIFAGKRFEPDGRCWRHRIPRSRS